MKKVVIVLVLAIVGVFVFRYLNETTKTKNEITKYKKDTEMANVKVDAFFRDADEFSSLKDESKYKSTITDKLLPDLEAVEGDFAMISCSNEQVQKLHSELVEVVKSTMKELKKAKKADTKKVRKKVLKAVQKLAKEYDHYLLEIEDIEGKYLDEAQPKATEKATKYDQYDNLLNSTK